jgi:putative tryptophan/tyrosine transport system substrate-binding protein
VNRREFITLLGGAATWPLAARAQQPERMRRIGVLFGTSELDLVTKEYLSAFAQGLAPLGLSEGRNMRIETRWAGLLRPSVSARSAGRASVSRSSNGQDQRP